MNKKYLLAMMFASSLLAACNDTADNHKKTIPNNDAQSSSAQNYRGAKLQLVKEPEFTMTKSTSSVNDQMHFYLTREATLNLNIYNANNDIVSTKTNVGLSSEHMINIGSTYDNSALDYGAYTYEATFTLTNSEYQETFTGNFTKQLKEIKHFEEKISDISILGNELLIATGDMMDPIKLFSLNINTQNVDVDLNEFTADIIETLPAPVYDMANTKKFIYIGGRFDQWMGGQLLLEYDKENKTTRSLDHLFACKTATDSLPCTSVFSLANTNDGLYIGTDKGLFLFNKNQAGQEQLKKITHHGLGENTDFKTLYQDSKGWIWAGSMIEEGITFYDGMRWHPLTSETSVIPAGGYLAIAEGENNDYYFANNVSGLVKYNIDTEAAEIFTPRNSNIIDHNLVSVAYTDSVIVGSHDYGIAKLQDTDKWVITNNTNSMMQTIETSSCQWSPDSPTCKDVLVVERIIQNREGRTFTAIGKSIYEIF